MEDKQVFYSLVATFLLFFTSFAAFIYPNRGALHPVAFVGWLSKYLPSGFSAPLAIIKDWSFSVFYVMSEMWGSVVSSLLFWKTANGEHQFVLS